MSQLRQLLEVAVQAAIHPGRTGIVVSGGIDSSTVARLAGYSFPTFTGWYDHPGCDERSYARLVRGDEHHEIEITPADFIAYFDAFAHALTPPYQGMGAFGQYMVGRAIAERGDVDVVLSGEGSDELFGGYTRLMIVAGVDRPDGYDDYVLPADYPRTLVDALAYDYERLPDLLAVDDQCMNAHGLEARAPFTDPRVVEHAMALLPEWRVGKIALKRAVRGLVPDEIIDRTDKMGFPTPFVAWANGPLRDFVSGRLGYLPDPGKPYARGWFHEMCALSVKAEAA